MSFAARPVDPLDEIRVEVETAHEHLRRIRERVALRQLDAAALPPAELRYQHALKRWTATVRGEGSA